jgi:HJR/Mrr/RecB family endonuclease
MAELAVISSGLGIASFAIQVADSVVKLKDFIDSVREAPEEIKHIIRQIEALSLVLSTCDTEDDEAGVSEAVSNATNTCQILLSRAAGSLELVIKDLEMAIGKRRKMGSVKAVLKQGMVDRLRQRLRDAQDLLVLSNQYYSQ